MTNAPIIIRVADFTGEPIAVSAEDGQRLCGRIAPLLAADAPVDLSFAGIEVVIGAFLSAAIGPLCTGFTDEELGSLLTFGGLSSDDRATMNQSIRNARKYLVNPAAYDAAWGEEMVGD